MPPAAPFAPRHRRGWRPAAAAVACCCRPASSQRFGAASWGSEQVRVSDVYAENLLPSFFWMAGSEEGGSYVDSRGWQGGLGTPRPYDPPDGCPDFVFDDTMADTRVPVLPYLEQDDWGCERAPREVRAVVLENAELRAAVVPQWGGKVWSLYHKGLRRHLLFNNPAHQPLNGGYRKAWSAGGVEWNWGPGLIGHSVFTEEAVHVARIPTERGDVVRVWEYDRLNHTVWQVDLMLDGGSMLAHVTVTNPGAAPQRGYWWTNAAMHASARTRIVTPAAQYLDPCASWPDGAWTLHNTSFRGPAVPGAARRAWEQDMSWLGNIPTSHDFFMQGWHAGKRYPLPYIVWVGDGGLAVAHAHGRRDQPGFMNGTKFFTWGQGMGGQFQQDFLSASDYENTRCLQEPGTYYNYYDPDCAAYEHAGNYCELQVGPARSQMHTFAVPANGTVGWTEVFKAWLPNVTRMHAADYFADEGPVQEAERWLESPAGVPWADFGDADAFLEGIAATAPAPGQVLAQGQPWGALHERMSRRRLAPGAPFNGSNLSADPRTRMWVELVDTGGFSAETLARIPTSFQTGTEWVALLAASLAKGPETWLHHLLLGTAALEAGDRDAGVRALRDSARLRPNVQAARGLAVAAGSAAEQLAYYQEAWDAWEGWDPADPARARLGRNLASELAIWMAVNGEWGSLRPFLAALPGACPAAGCETDRVRDARAQLAVRDGDYHAALEILSTHCFPTYWSDKSRLINAWYAAHQQMERARLGRNLTRADTLHLRRRIGCDADDAAATWRSPCRRGPPNLGAL